MSLSNLPHLQPSNPIPDALPALTTLDTLTAHFGLPGILAFDAAPSGLLRARVTTPACSAEIYLHGAHLTHWQPAGEAPVLFLSDRSAFVPDKPIRGGVPLIFPWFGARTATPENPRPEDQRTDGPSHGFARLEDWTLAFAALSGDNLHLTFTLAPTAQSRALGFDHFRLAYEVVLGRTLTLRLTVANDAAHPLRIEEAFHTYFAVGDAEQVSILGLQGVDFLDKTDHFARKHQADPAVTFRAETDRPYLNTTATVTLEDPILERRIVIAKEGSETTVVWNPWVELSAKTADLDPDAWRTMACVETANAADNALTLAPHTAHTMQAQISVERT
jgi:glucose-6-phosphate 1-epimerase